MDDESSKQQTDVRGPLVHSGYGLASFTIAIVAITANILLWLLWVLIPQPPGGQRFPDDQYWTGFLVACTTIPVNFIGAVLGVVGCCQRGRKKLFAVLELILNVGFWPVIILIIEKG